MFKLEKSFIDKKGLYELGIDGDYSVIRLDGSAILKNTIATIVNKKWKEITAIPSSTFKYITTKPIPSEVTEIINIILYKNNGSFVDPLEGDSIVINKNYSRSAGKILIAHIPWSGNYFARFDLHLNDFSFKTHCHKTLLKMLKSYYNI